MKLVERPQGQTEAEQKLKPKFQLNLKRLLSILTAFAGLAVYSIYVTKGWSGYERIPGGRGLMLIAAIIALVGLAGARVYVAVGAKGLRRSAASAWQSERTRTWLPVSLIVALALVVRLWGINFGMPYLEQVDEWAVADRALHIVQAGNFDPLDYRNPALREDDRQAFTYPSLYMYLQTGVFSLKFLQGVSAGVYDGTSGLSELPIKSDFYLWGRALTAILGAGTVLLLYLVGRKFYDHKVGLIAAFFLSFFYLHVINSRFITTDVPSGFFAVLPFLFIYPIMMGKNERKYYLLAGFCAGLAVGTKYNNALILLPLILAHLTGREWRKWFSGGLPLAGVAMFGGFFVSSPFIFFHLPNFLTDIAAVIEHYQNSGHAGFEGSNNWWYYLQAMSNENLAVVVLGVTGIVIAFARHRKHEIVLLSFPLISYLQLSSYKVNFTRNLMPFVPFLALFAAMALVVGLQWATQKWLKWQTPVLVGLAILVCINPALSIAQQTHLNAQPTTRARATQWLQANAPRGSKLWLEPFSVELLPRNSFRLEGGKSVLENPLDWYIANNFNYIVLSEAYYKGTLEGGKPEAQAAYRKLLEGQLPPGFAMVQDFKGNDSDKPGARITVFSTGLKLVAKDLAEFGGTIKPFKVDLGGKIRLVGADFPEKAEAGKTLPLVLYWQTVATIPQNYTVFVHLLDEKGNRISQLDLPPLAGTRPTNVWQPGEIVRDDYPLALPANLAAGNYRVQVGFYEAPNGGRLILADGKDAIELSVISVTGKK